MLMIFQNLRDVTLLSTTVRLLLAVLCGGLIGLERSYKHRPAGFRTHILICLGAAMTTLTSQYLYLTMHYYTDMARLGAQVIAGIGFIGAGTIIVTHHQHVKGLTTAAGLWAAAIIGLALGAGFYEGALLTTVMILIAELFLPKWEFRITQAAPEVKLYIEYCDKACLDQLFHQYHKNNIQVVNIEMIPAAHGEASNASSIFTLRLPKKLDTSQFIQSVTTIPGILFTEEL